MSLRTGRQAMHNQNRMTWKIFGSIVQKSNLLFEFYILDLPALLSLE
jgi:hypothetical protein